MTEVEYIKMRKENLKACIAELEDTKKKMGETKELCESLWKMKLDLHFENIVHPEI